MGNNEYVTKTFGFACVLLALLALGFGINAGIIEYNSSVQMANLQLADDASTPEKKAQFLRDFLADMEEARLPTHAAWLWTSPRNKISNQKVVIESLIKRCDDLSVLNKESMGYAQGMTQITGQEFDHVLGDVKEIYSKAYSMRYGWFPLNSWWIFLSLSGLCLLVVLINEA